MMIIIQWSNYEDIIVSLIIIICYHTFVSSQLKSRNKRYEQAWTWGTVIKELEIKN